MYIANAHIVSLFIFLLGPNVYCQLIKRSEDEANFIKAARGCVPGVIQMHTGTHVGRHRNTEAQVAMLKPSQKRSMGV